MLDAAVPLQRARAAPPPAWTVATILLLSFTLAGAASPAATPLQTVEQAVTTVLGLLRSAAAASQSPSSVQRTSVQDQGTAEMRRIAERLFDTDEVARRALVHHWAARTPTERAEFARLFKELLERTYIRKLQMYAGEQIVFLGERLDGKTATVLSRISRPEVRETTTLDYRLHLKDGRWQVYDVLIDGVSFVANYRSQFDRIIRQSSYEGMIQQLRSTLESHGEPVAASPRTGGSPRKAPR